MRKKEMYYLLFIIGLLLLHSCQLPLEPGLLSQASPVKAEKAPNHQPALKASPAMVPISPSPAPVLQTPSPVPSTKGSDPVPIASNANTIAATPSPLLTPQPLSSPAIEVLEAKIQVEGLVTDDEKRPLPGVKISIRVLETDILLKETVTDNNGSYKVWVSDTLLYKITASKEGYTSKVVLPHFRFSGSSDVKSPIRADFTGEYNKDVSAFNYPTYGYTLPLSLRPEVNQVSPASGATTELDTPLILTFSHSMDKASVEQSFEIRAYNDITLLVDKGHINPTFVGLGNISESKGTLIYDKAAFSFNWNADSNQLTIVFKDGYVLPTHPSLLNHYQITFSSVIKNQSGMMRETAFFYYNNAAHNSTQVSYKVKPDASSPLILNSTSQNNAIQLHFNKPMLLNTSTLPIAGGMADRNGVTDAYLQAPAEYPNNKGISTASAAADNYTVRLRSPSDSNTSITTKTWKEWGGKAVFDPQDSTKVNLTFPTATQEITAFVRNNQTISTQPLATPIATDTEDNSTWKWGWQLVKSDGAPMNQFLTTDLETGQSNTSTPLNATKLAELLQNQLNLSAYTTELSLPTSANPWKVQASVDEKFLSITFTDTTRSYIGWRWASGTYTLSESDKWPTALTGLDSWAAGTPMNPFKTGDTLEIEVAATVTDPAGNPMNPDKKKAMVTIP